VIALHHLEGLSVEEVAAALGCRVGTVKARLSRGRARMRVLLAPYSQEILS
jgi:RNA polymerase sigma-70 factor (ECF subfamily)